MANLTRNIEISCTNEAVAYRGQVMVMHTIDVDLKNVTCVGLGRSDKSIP